MTVHEMIHKLQQVEHDHGPNVEVFFDCPRCGTAFAPDVLVKAAVHLSTPTGGCGHVTVQDGKRYTCLQNKGHEGGHDC